MSKPPKPPFHATPDADRLATAKRYASRLVDHIATLFTMHEANRIVIYSDTLSKQIPRSYAAHAFNQFQRSMHMFELVRLCALWDKPSLDRESIPTILALINKSDIVETLVTETHRYFASELAPTHVTPIEDAEQRAALDEWWDKEHVSQADEETFKLRVRLLEAQTQADETLASPELAALRSFRHNYIAHNLSQTDPDRNAPTEVRGVRYGDEVKLLEITVQIADRLHLALNGANFMWDDSREIARKNAAALWEACRFMETQ